MKFYNKLKKYSIIVMCFFFKKKDKINIIKENIYKYQIQFFFFFINR